MFNITRDVIMDRKKTLSCSGIPQKVPLQNDCPLYRRRCLRCRCGTVDPMMGSSNSPVPKQKPKAPLVICHKQLIS
ncbi:hypothetical protein TNCV_3270151 [Trichonephila clavipes]|uniref:Uncharacterized protein n=1 Tax=Trichonephila clavipes TaxID=2585209 RepID=A0A8X6S5H8_TRICX|nr:hypothetical protein TNCV_3270151 [Trichonephila clavipes]